MSPELVVAIAVLGPAAYFAAGLGFAYIVARKTGDEALALLGLVWPVVVVTCIVMVPFMMVVEKGTEDGQ